MQPKGYYLIIHFKIWLIRTNANFYKKKYQSETYTTVFFLIGNLIGNTRFLIFTCDLSDQKNKLMLF